MTKGQGAQKPVKQHKETKQKPSLMQSEKPKGITKKQKKKKSEKQRKEMLDKRHAKHQRHLQLEQEHTAQVEFIKSAPSPDSKITLKGIEIGKQALICIFLERLLRLHTGTGARENMLLNKVYSPLGLNMEAALAICADPLLSKYVEIKDIDVNEKLQLANPKKKNLRPKVHKFVRVKDLAAVTKLLDTLSQSDDTTRKQLDAFHSALDPSPEKQQELRLKEQRKEQKKQEQDERRAKQKAKRKAKEEEKMAKAAERKAKAAEFAATQAALEARLEANNDEDMDSSSQSSSSDSSDNESDSDESMEDSCTSSESGSSSSSE